MTRSIFDRNPKVVEAKLTFNGERLATSIYFGGNIVSDYGLIENERQLAEQLEVFVLQFTQNARKVPNAPLRKT